MKLPPASGSASGVPLPPARQRHELHFRGSSLDRGLTGRPTPTRPRTLAVLSRPVPMAQASSRHDLDPLAAPLSEVSSGSDPVSTSLPGPTVPRKPLCQLDTCAPKAPA